MSERAALLLDESRGHEGLDRWLRFEPKLEERYEAEHGAERVASLRHAIYVGLILYNAYNLTSIVLLPDILWLSVTARVFLVTPVSLGLAWLLGRVSPAQREWLVLNGIVNAFVLPVFLFWLTAAPLGNYTFGEFSLTLVFGNMLLALRFRHAAMFTVAAFAVVVVALAAKADLDPALRAAFVVQIATACIFSLYANYRIERRRCLDYLRTVRAVLKAEQADANRQKFQDLSRTDALTGLPNRRFLDERLGEWFADHRPAALMMIDIDHFKLFNDALGHPRGDECLLSVGTVIASAADGPDRVCARYGGEEFTLVVRDVTEIEALRIADGLVQAIAALGIAHPGRRDGARFVTASIGVAVKPAGGSASQGDVIAQADRALYDAKRQGRNRCTLGGRRGDAMLQSA
ncbi:hypothetical protein ASG59_14895 [Methylobacterium sp. Leaf466]|nr:hypothetical protein ASG59_14895 [Methylobacterium sp. Leaf466]